jgi:hypothetical protein
MTAMSETTGAAGPLAFTVPPHLVHPSKDLVCWFTDPPGIVIQIVNAVPGTLSMASWLGRTAQAALFARFPGVHDLIVVLDLRSMTGREPAARGGLVEPAKRMKSRVTRTILLPPKNASQVYLGSMYAATALLSAFGVHVDIQRGMGKVLASYGLRAAAH